MPTINLKETKVHNSKDRPKSESTQILAKLYNNTKWGKLRRLCLVHNPLCKRCLQKDKINCAQEVHHINPVNPHSYDVEETFYDEDNVMPLCKKCHNDLHTILKLSPREYNRIISEIRKLYPIEWM